MIELVLTITLMYIVVAAAATWYRRQQKAVGAESANSERTY